MIVQGSMSTTYSGRRRKTVRRKTRKTVFKEYKPKENFMLKKMKQYPSHPEVGEIRGTAKTGNEVTYTVAPAYNKGPYMVIPNSEIKDIGR